uniref:RxLR effector candidate protein n=2 Tax=Hyaloperonospora arabidopsidis (strain Emoy2) TaxID=559515 RepID=M4C2J4_HYAAE
MRPSLGVVSEMTTVQESIQPNQVPEVADSAGKLVLFAKSPHGIEMGKKGLRHLSNYWATRQRGVVGVLADLKLTKRKLNFYRIKALEDFIEDAFGVEKCDTELTKALVVIYGESHLSFLLTYNLLKKRNTDYALKLLAGVMTPWVNGGFTVEKVAGMLHHTKGIDFDQVAGMLRHTKGIDFKQVVQNLASSSTSASKAQYINLWTLKLYNGLCSHKRPELAIKEMFLK